MTAGTATAVPKPGLSNRRGPLRGAPASGSGDTSGCRSLHTRPSVGEPRPGRQPAVAWATAASGTDSGCQSTLQVSASRPGTQSAPNARSSAPASPPSSRSAPESNSAHSSRASETDSYALSLRSTRRSEVTSCSRPARRRSPGSLSSRTAIGRLEVADDAVGARSDSRRGPRRSRRPAQPTRRPAVPDPSRGPGRSASPVTACSYPGSNPGAPSWPRPAPWRGFRRSGARETPT